MPTPWNYGFGLSTWTLPSPSFHHTHMCHGHPLPWNMACTPETHCRHSISEWSLQYIDQPIDTLLPQKWHETLATAICRGFHLFCSALPALCCSSPSQRTTALSQELWQLLMEAWRWNCHGPEEAKAASLSLSCNLPIGTMKSEVTFCFSRKKNDDLKDAYYRNENTHVLDRWLAGVCLNLCQLIHKNQSSLLRAGRSHSSHPSAADPGKPGQVRRWIDHNFCCRLVLILILILIIIIIIVIIIIIIKKC